MSVDFSHMTTLLSVFDMPTALKFYRDILGFVVIQDTGQGDESGWVMLQKSGVTVMLNTAYDDDERPAAPNPAHHSVHQDTCLYFLCSDPQVTYEFLKSKGLQLDPPKVAYYGMNQLYLRDPDGYTLCFQAPAESDHGEPS
jgi:catechol 2,3-dioxygenase-like lactoylglutathione lyase family enzyme